MKIHYATISETGKRRKNEDAFRIVNSEDSNCWLAMVCDGMGGHAMGEVASETVSNAIVNYWKKHTGEPDSETKVNNACVHAMGVLDKEYDSLNHCQMGTTMVMASIEGDTVTIAHVGDSRCYLQRHDMGLIYKAKDHVRLDYGWEVIDRCFFSYHHEADVPDIMQFKLKAGDRILLCSDGLYKSMSPDILLARMMDDKPLAEIFDVYEFMCKKQGDDNYTAVLIKVKEQK
ncbi:MAG: protein phosphatase 2C domain-containing protein [Bacteroidales bacterium]|nr:protein phosphatase 2C domain-containing protein [Bacteroidales bacterium]